jgi:hypothetical protein
VSINVKRFPLPKLLLASALALAFCGNGAGSALAAEAAPDTSSCAEPELFQPFLWSQDSGFYTLVPGQDEAGFNGEGWTLSGGAKVVSDGGRNLLDLPSGSKALSPTICVTSEYPRARMMVRNVVGSEGVFFYVSYAGTPTWSKPKNTGQVHGTGTVLTLSDPVNLQPPSVSGWQLVRFTLIPGGKASDFRICEFWVDPFARH